MALFESIMNLFEGLGISGLFILSFIEAIFFPIPPDSLLIPLTLIKPKFWLIYSLIASIGSVSGAILGYHIGKKGGRPFLKKFFREERIKKVENYYKNYGDLAVFIAGFSPIPYKVFTISSGVFNHHFYRFVLFSFLSRFLRFSIESFLIFNFGREIIEFLRKDFAFISLLLAVLSTLIFIVIRRVKNKPVN